MAIDINRKTTSVILEPEVAAEIWQETQEQSAIMALAQTMDVPGNGKTFQTITGDPVAEWVAETDEKPISSFSFGSKTVTPYKAAVIVPFSKEFLRDKSTLYNACVGRLPGALAKLFDSTVMGTVAPGQGFDVLGTATQVALSSTGTYDTFVDVAAAIGAAGGVMDGVALAPQGNSTVLKAKDNSGHPLFTAGVGTATVGNILGARTSVSKNIYVAGSGGQPAVVGVAGDWSEAAYGIVDGISLTISDQATLVSGSGGDQEIIPLWQRNMVAALVEFEVAFCVRNINRFALLTQAAQ